jgi:hypothetical protein
MENFRWIILAAASQALLTVAILMLLGARRRKAYLAGQVGSKAMLDDRAWPDDVLKASNNFKSQFEVPVLFFAAISVALATGITATAFAVMCWVFVAARLGHSIVHCGSNVLGPRFGLFMVSVVAVAGMWLLIAKRMVVGL